MTRVLDGLPVSGGIVEGRPVIVNVPADAARVEQGDIVVLPNSDPRYALGVMRAAGLICEDGGRLSHVCVVSVEMGIPCITRAKDARAVLSQASWVRLNGTEGSVDDLSPR